MKFSLEQNKIASYLLTLAFLFLFYPFQIYSAWNWTNNSSNPVIYSNQWIHIQNPSIVKKDNNYLSLIEANNGMGWRISIATSSSENINWKISNTSIIPIGLWDIYHSNPTLIFNPTDKIYQAWFSGYSANVINGPDRFRVGYATSSNGINWEKYEGENKWVLVGDKTKWDEGGIARGLSIVLLNNIYHLWYTATNSDQIGTNWKIGYATSPDGKNWTKYSGNPVITKTESWEYNNLMYPFVIYENGKFKMWYGTGTGDMCTRYVYAESTNGYDWTKPADKNFVYQASGVNGAFDKTALAGLSLLREGDMYKIWYSGFDGSHWSIGYATASADPIQASTKPIVIIPGMMASWNKEAILENQSNPSSAWQLLPFVKEYDGLIQTLKNLGYEEGKTVFLWPYDWRKPIETSALQLNQFIETTVKPANPNQKIILIGHSLGGLIARAWAQSNTNLVHQLVIVASPQKGLIQPYKAWEGGDIIQENSFLSLAARIIIELHRRTYPTTRQVVQNIFPVLKDLLPTENYLKRQSDNSVIPITSMAVQNTWLASLNAQADPLYPLLDTLYGIGTQTPAFYKVEPRSWLDAVLGNWEDGKPASQETDDGDGMVHAARALLQDPAHALSQTHSGAIADKASIKDILQILHISANESDLVAGQTTTIQPSILFLLRSPATLTVSYNGTVQTDYDGIVFIPNALDGTYQTLVTGTGSGTYRLAIGQFTQTAHIWKEYIGQTTSGKQTPYTINFNSTSPLEDPATNLSEKEYLEQINLRLEDIRKLSKHNAISKAQFALRMCLQALNKKDYLTMKKQLEQILIEMSSLRKSNPSDSVRLMSFLVADTVIDAYHAILSKKSYSINQKELTQLTALCKKEEDRIYTALEKKLKAGKNVTRQTHTLSEAKTYKLRADQTSPSQQTKQYILLFQTQLLFREIGV